MNIIKVDGWRLLIANGLSVKEGKKLFRGVKQRNFEQRHIFKDGDRSEVRRILLRDRDIIWKVPVEKNNSAWIQATTLYRQSEAFRNLLSMEVLRDTGLLSTIPLIAAEERKKGKVQDSWLLYEYLEGESCLSREDCYPMIVDKLKEIHSKGFLHGDAQIRNFLIKDGRIYTIDANPKPIGAMGFSKAYEFVYLQRSAPGIEKYFGDMVDKPMYKLAQQYDQLSMKLNRKRKGLLSKIGLR